MQLRRPEVSFKTEAFSSPKEDAGAAQRGRDATVRFRTPPPAPEHPHASVVSRKQLIPLSFPSGTRRAPCPPATEESRSWIVSWMRDFGGECCGARRLDGGGGGAWGGDSPFSSGVVGGFDGPRADRARAGGSRPDRGDRRGLRPGDSGVRG